MPTPIGRDRVRRLVAEGAQLIEVLAAKEYDEQHLPDARSIPLSHVTEDDDRVAALDRSRPVVVYCWDSL
jgi:rhodanese-related sulfurtransferase